MASPHIHPIPCTVLLDWDSSKHAKKVSGYSWNSTNSAHAHLGLICPTTILIGPFQSTAWNTVITPPRVLRLIAPPPAVPRCATPDALKRGRAWFRSCLFMCTLLELFVIQSSYLSTHTGLCGKCEDYEWFSLLYHSNQFCKSGYLAYRYFVRFANILDQHHNFLPHTYTLSSISS